MIRTVYVVTTAPGARARAVRLLAGLLAARIVLLLTVLGHVVVQLVGAADAYATAVLGIPRLAVLGRRLQGALRETWEA